ncbi:MAG: CoA transferase [Planctomycetes bacterium]|nr:CoA transferase [Planctomycetota bacterium]
MNCSENLLSGLRVLDLTRMLAGPYATMLLADLGSEVIKIEEPGEGDEIRKMGPPFIKSESAYFMSINRNKKSLTLNLKTDEGKKIFYDLVAKSDIVLDNFRPGILERLKCDHETLSKINPRLITCSITSFGEEGELAQLPAFDLVIQAYSGAMSITGEPGKPPVRMGIPLGDLAGGIFASLAVSSSLYRRSQTGHGEHISISLLDSLTSMLTYVAQYYLTDKNVPGPQGSRHMSCVPYGAFKTKDIYIVVAVFTEKFWGSFCRAIEHPELSEDRRFYTNKLRVENRSILEPLLEKIFLAQSGDIWLRALQKEGIPCAPINTIEHVLDMEQLKLRDMLIKYEHPLAGEITSLGSPIKTGDVKSNFKPSPLLGEHTAEILSQLLNMKQEKINLLRSKGII